MDFICSHRAEGTAELHAALRRGKSFELKNHFRLAFNRKRVNFDWNMAGFQATGWESAHDSVLECGAQRLGRESISHCISACSIENSETIWHLYCNSR